jgi:hypothetical protein
MGGVSGEWLAFDHIAAVDALAVVGITLTCLTESCKESTWYVVKHISKSMNVHGLWF